MPPPGACRAHRRPCRPPEYGKAANAPVVDSTGLKECNIPLRRLKECNMDARLKRMNKKFGVEEAPDW